MRHLISLGYRCDVAFQLRMHSGENVSHFFDWLVTPATGLVDVLRRDFEVFAPDHLEPEHESGHPQVMDKATGIRFLHHFATYEGKIPASFLSVYPEFIAKFRYMAARFRDYSQNKPCTFVRWRIDEKQARLVEEAFFERFPKADARFLYVNPTGKTFVTDHGHSRQLPNNNFTMGDPIAWAELLLDEGLVTHPYRLSVLDILGTGHDNYNMSANNRFTVEHMQAAIAANPEKADYHYELARIYRKTDRIAAERALDQALALDPGNLIYQALKVTFLKGANQLDGQDYINALTSCLMPSDGNGVLLPLAEAHLHARNFRQAVVYFNKYLENRPTDAKIYYDKALALRNCGDNLLAELAIDFSLRLMPKKPRSHLLRSLILSSTGRMEEAVSAARRAVTLDDTHAHRHNLAQILLKAG